MSTSLQRTGVWVAIAVLIIATGVYIFTGPLSSSGMLRPISPSVVAQPIGDLPNMPNKPQPKEITFDGCPPEGQGGDSQLNLLKNRVDEGKYVPVSFDSLTMLTWPKNIEQAEMKDWLDSNRAFIDRYQGIPVMVEGYILSVREGLPDPANCNRTGTVNLDWHIYFTKNPRDDRSTAILMEVPPRVRLDHRWTIDLIHSVIMGDHLPVRLSGWLYFDPAHPADVGQIRATLWEINPVMQIDVFVNGRWSPLDKFANQ